MVQEVIKIKNKIGGYVIMDNINNIEDLINTLGKEKVDKLFIEYFMLIINKSNLLNQEK